MTAPVPPKAHAAIEWGEPEVRPVIGIDPGTTIMASVLIAPGAPFRWFIAKGTPKKRPTKKEPSPKNPSPYLVTSDVCEGTINNWGAAFDWKIWQDHHCLEDLAKGPIVAIEAGAFSKNGRQDALAAIRQCLFDLLAGLTSPRGAESIFRPVSPNSAKKALTGYAGADKRRMVVNAALWIEKHAPERLADFGALGDKAKESIADALGIALAVVEWQKALESKKG